MSAENEIRFINSRYQELFCIQDGEYITITRPEGELLTRQCKRLDECHLSVEGNVYHICEFAEKMERIGAVYAPEPIPENVHGYVIKNRVPVGELTFVLAHNPNAVQPFVTWQAHKEREGYDWGHYFPKKQDAETDLIRRVHAERTGTPYRPAQEKKIGERER